MFRKVLEEKPLLLYGRKKKLKLSELNKLWEHLNHYPVSIRSVPGNINRTMGMEWPSRAELGNGNCKYSLSITKKRNSLRELQNIFQ